MGTFYVCYYHIIWATKHRQALITPAIEPVLINSVQQKAHQHRTPIHAINMVADHIHIAVTIPPSKAIWEWVRDVKGLTAHDVNSEFSDLEETFKWQRGYSVHTFGKKVLPYIVEYIEKQKIHHEAGTIEPYLEYIED